MRRTAMQLLWGRTSTAEELWARWSELEPPECVPPLANIRTNLADPEVCPERNLLVARDEDGRIAGFVLCVDEQTLQRPEIYAFRIVGAEVAPLLVAELERRAQAACVDLLKLGFDRRSPISRMYEGLGFRHDYSAFELAQPIRPASSPKLRTSLVVVDSVPDPIGAWVSVENEAFRGDPHGVLLTREEGARLLSETEEGPPGLHFALENDTPVGFCFTRFLTPDVAEINTLGVRPSHQRLGLGRALIEAAVDRLGRLGVRTVRITVISKNETALALYQRAGFHSFSEKLVVAKRLDLTGRARTDP